MKNSSETAFSAFEKGYRLSPRAAPKRCPFLTGLARSKWLEGGEKDETTGEGLTNLTCYKLSGFIALLSTRLLRRLLNV